IPLHVWSRETFAKIGNKWGEALDIEDNFGSSFARKRLCILTKQPESILEKFKVIFKGKVFVARAKELFTWNPSFLEPKESVYTSDDESKHGAKILNDGAQNSDVESDDECNVDGVSETIFSDNVDECNVDGHGKETDKHQSEDPFGFYDLLNKLPAKGVRDASTSLSHPPGFTPKTSVTHANVGEICEDGPTNGEDMVNMPRVDAKVMDHSQEVHDSSNGESVSSFSHKVHNGGSILDILDDMVRVGHSMGYNLDGCLGHKTKKEWVKELNCKHRINFLALQETKMDCISHMDVKSLWGNSNFDFVASDSLGNSGGILCIWEASIFKKDGATISDNFIAIYGTWLPRNVKILLVAVYAPQQPGSKRALWDFLSNLVRRWNGEAIIIGDFNDVRTMDERLGSSFNVSSARCFDRFIVSSGLVDVKLEGYSFTWSHPSASKMSKLDRFLVTEGIISLYPSISALCLDRHLSDHRPILLREVLSDFGPTPFRFYQSWLRMEGFDSMVEHAWLSFSHSDSMLWLGSEVMAGHLSLLFVYGLKINKGWILNEGCNVLNLEVKDLVQKSKIKWAIEGDENSKFFHVNDATFVNDFRPISLIGCVYKVITKVLANRLATVISDLVSETQSAFVANRQILDGPFILNEMLNWCKRKKKQAMFFKVDFAKAYDSVRWDYLLDILHAFGFGPNWCRWIRGTFTSSMASILVNGSPTSEFPFCCGLKQGDPLAPYLFILIMESLHISFSRVVDDGLFKGFQLHGSVNISHLFYADDAMFIGEWSEQNLHNIVKVLNCFHLASGLKINIAKSQVLGVGVSQNVVVQAANRIGCAVLNTPFRYLGVTVGECMSRKSAWVGLVNKLQARLSKWKVKTLSIGGRLTLLKSVLGASPIYYMSIFKVPKGVLKTMESIRSKFFNGVDSSDRKISWVAWDNVLASKLNGGLGVSSFFALNRALLLKWVWRFISGDGSLWCKVIQAIYGSKFDLHVTDQPSIWCSILREVKSLKDSGFDFSSHCKKRIGDGSCTSFWYDIWLADAPLCVQFPRLFALELDKEIVVANKMGASSVSASFR
ncbi:RNA-directed DNA polymerase, eukaryota, partial [Tanacetum coccineum]